MSHSNLSCRYKEGVEVKLYSFLNLGARCRWVLKAMPRPLDPLERAPVPIVQEAGWALGPIWTGVENRISLAPPGFEP